MQEIYYNRQGKVIEGSQMGKYILLIDDTKGKTGGYYLYNSSKNFNDEAPVYDNWYENYDTVLDFFANNKIEWLEEETKLNDTLP